MAITKEDLQDFHRVADEKLANGGAESLADLARQWEEQREDQQSAAALRQSHADAESGRLHAAEDVFAEARSKLGLDE